MRVKQIDKALDFFELFAKSNEPQTLTELSAALDMPKSSAFNLLDTLLSRGYIYETRQRGGYYPTRRLYDVARQIMDGDIIVQAIHGELENLARETGETVLLAARHGAEVLYVDVVEANSPIRYFARLGERKPLCSTASGKAILLTFDAEERARIVHSASGLDGLSNAPKNPEALLKDLEKSAERGWSEDQAEFIADVMGIGVPLVHGSRRFGLAIAGPLYRMRDSRAVLVDKLLTASRQMRSMIGDDGERDARTASKP